MTGVKWLRIGSSGTMYITLDNWLMMATLMKKVKKKSKTVAFGGYVYFHLQRTGECVRWLMDNGNMSL
jgi:hypothetical protein